jgi:hypothetical protein
VPGPPVPREYQDKHLRIEFEDGEIAEVFVLLVSECEEHEDCRGLVYEVVSTDQPRHSGRGTTYWTEMKYIKRFELLGEKTTL